MPKHGAALSSTACTASTMLHEATEAMQGAAGELLALYEAVVGQAGRTGPDGEGHSGAVSGGASVLAAGSPGQEQSGQEQPEGESAWSPLLPHGPLAQLRVAGPELHADLRGCMRRAFQALQQQLRDRQQQQQQAQVGAGVPVGLGGAATFLGTAFEPPDVQQGGGRLASCVHECWATLDAVLEGSAGAPDRAKRCDAVRVRLNVSSMTGCNRVHGLRVQPHAHANMFDKCLHSWRMPCR